MVPGVSSALAAPVLAGATLLAHAFAVSQCQCGRLAAISMRLYHVYQLCPPAPPPPMGGPCSHMLPVAVPVNACMSPPHAPMCTHMLPVAVPVNTCRSPPHALMCAHMLPAAPPMAAWGQPSHGLVCTFIHLPPSSNLSPACALEQPCLKETHTSTAFPQRLSARYLLSTSPGQWPKGG